MLRSQLAHTASHKLREVVENIGEQDEFLGIEQRRCRVIQQLGALDSDPDTANFVFSIPELGHLFVEAFELLGELFGRDHGCVRVALRCFGVESSLPVLALTHPNGFINLFAFSAEVVADLLSISQRFKHRKDLELFCLPRLEVERLRVLKVGEVRERIELDIEIKRGQPCN